MTKMAGVTRAKAWFTKGTVYFSPCDWKLPEIIPGQDSQTEKSTLWTDAGVDQNFQTDLGAIGPYEFQGKFVWTNGPFAFFSLKTCMEQWP